MNMVGFNTSAEALRDDYMMFLDYLEENNVVLSTKTTNIGKKDCFEINSMFNIFSERYQKATRFQKYYAVIDFFFFFSVKIGILNIVTEKGKGVVAKRTSVYDSFIELPAIGQYALMLIVAASEYLDRIRDSYPESRFIFDFFNSKKKNESIISRREEDYWGSSYFYGVRVFALFNLLRVEWLLDDEVDQENTYRIKRLFMTEQGVSFVKAYNKYEDKTDEYSLGSLLSYIKDMLSLSDDLYEELFDFIESKEESGNKTILLTVSIGSCKRKIKIGDQFTLEKLHDHIQSSVDFDNDHLYYFEIGTGTNMERYYSSHCRGERYLANKCVLAELKLYEGMRFIYLFDFGDSWRFNIKIDKILNEVCSKAELIGMKGNAPVQYPFYDEDDDEDDEW